MDIQAILDQVEESVVTIETSVNAQGGVFDGRRHAAWSCRPTA